MNMFKCTVCDIKTTSASRLFSRARTHVRTHARTHVGTHVTLPKSSPSACVEKNLQQHLQGRLHRKRQERNAAADRSIYVRGFSEGTSISMLETFFRKTLEGFQDLWMSSSMPPYALVEFSNSECASKALQATHLKVDGKALVIKPRILQATSSSSTTPSGNGDQHKQVAGKGPGKKVGVKMAAQSSMHSDRADWDYIAGASSVDAQLERLSERLAQSQESINDVLAICFNLLPRMRPSFPRCMVVPFGSTITGLSMQSSDCDISFISNPPESLVTLLTDKRYFSADSLATIERLEQDHDVKFRPPSQEYFPEHSAADDDVVLEKHKQSFGLIFDKVTFLLRRNKRYLSHVYPIRHARCPIIKFVHDETSLNCDISIEEHLGVLNTRLIKAYCEFDQRVVILIRLLKYWAREHHIPRLNLNSYALTLMMIYALQHCSPAVVPCLQEPNSWPLKGDKHDFHVENNVDPLLTYPSDVHFTSVQSLKPTLNSSSIASLLHHFFNFYGHTFDNKRCGVCVKSVKEMPLPKLTEQANNYARQNHKLVNVSRFFTPLVIQDPFDLSHNVTKMLSRDLFRVFVRRCREAAMQLQHMIESPSDVNVKKLFNEEDDSEKLTTKACKAEEADMPHQVTFSVQQVFNILMKGEKQGELEARLDELDWSSLEVQCALGQLVLVEIINVLTSKFDFTCEKLPDDSDIFEEEEEEDETECGKRKRIEEGHESEIQGILFESRKRQREEASSSTSSPKKKSKPGSYEVSVLDLLRDSVAKRGHYCNYLCTNDMIGWNHARRLQRALKQQQVQGELSSLHVLAGQGAYLDVEGELDEQGTSDESSTEPAMKFELGLGSCSVSSITLSANVQQGKLKDFCDLFAVLKKTMT